MRKRIILKIAAFTLALAATSAWAGLTEKEQLGKNLYFDVRLSNPAGQSCASCHSPGLGFNGIGDASVPVYEGAVTGRFGNRNPPSAAYASFSPLFRYDKSSGTYIGGQFWDGRAATLADQAKGPFLNPVEQNNASKSDVVALVASSNYASLFAKVYGAQALANIDEAYDDIANAIAAYEGSAEVNRFSSKYDWYVKNPSKYPLSQQEAMGLKLFDGKGGCSACHPSTSGPYADKALFTDFTYDNLGIPSNSPTTGEADLGLGAVVKDLAQNGKFKVPTLRNIGAAAGYGHNGYFTTLKEIIHFYNTRDVKGSNWPSPEVSENLNTTEVGDLKLSEPQEEAIAAFLMTLTDGYVPPAPR